MSKHHLRKDTMCQNCGADVLQRFCPNCGQENIETRQSFGHLVRHFAEDFTHYEGNFWLTLKYLMFRPAYLTKEYLSGKRMKFVAPVKLYIFVSFVAFFIPHFIPHFNHHHGSPFVLDLGRKTNETGHAIVRDKADAMDNAADGALTERDFSYYSTTGQYDSLQKALPDSLKDGAFDAFLNRRIVAFNNMPTKERNEKTLARLNANFPKLLFIILPLFAFVIWLFHSKKKWFYFDHAIFTLHYFSFLLLLVTFGNIVSNMLPWHWISKSGTGFISIITCIWAVYYFIRGHYKLYQGKAFVSGLKSVSIYIINLLLFVLLGVLFVFFTFLTIH